MYLYLFLSCAPRPLGLPKCSSGVTGFATFPICITTIHLYISYRRLIFDPLPPPLPSPEYPKSQLTPPFPLVFPYRWATSMFWAKSARHHSPRPHPSVVLRCHRRLHRPPLSHFATASGSLQHLNSTVIGPCLLFCRLSCCLAHPLWVPSHLICRFVFPRVTYCRARRPPDLPVAVHCVGVIMETAWRQM